MNPASPEIGWLLLAWLVIAVVVLWCDARSAAVSPADSQRKKYFVEKFRK